MEKSKYKQVEIPVVENKEWDSLKMGELKKAVKEYYEVFISGTSTKNLHSGVTILFTKGGIKHFLNFGKQGYTKLKMVQKLRAAVRLAEFKNFKKKDIDDAPNILGYLNYMVTVNVEGKNQRFRIVVRLTTEGKFYYHHSVRVQK